MGRFGSCGENIFIASHKVPWSYAIKSWFSEKDLFNYGCGGNNLTEVRFRDDDIVTVDKRVGGRLVTTPRWCGAPATSWAAALPSVWGPASPGASTTPTSVTTVHRESFSNLHVVRDFVQRKLPQQY